MIIANSIIVFDLDDTREKKRNLSFNADFDSLSFNEIIREFILTSLKSMQKKCFKFICAFVSFAYSNDCQRSNLQSFLKTTTIKFCQKKHTKRLNFSTQGHVFNSTSFDSNEQSNMIETANLFVKKFLTLKKTKKKTKIQNDLTRYLNEWGRNDEYIKYDFYFYVRGHG